MKKLLSFCAAALALASLLPVNLIGQDAKKSRELKEFYGRPSNWRPYDQSGINQFENLKSDSLPFEGLRIRFGAGFTQQWQSLKHENPGTLNNWTNEDPSD